MVLFWSNDLNWISGIPGSGDNRTRHSEIAAQWATQNIIHPLYIDHHYWKWMADDWLTVWREGIPINLWLMTDLDSDWRKARQLYLHVCLCVLYKPTQKTPPKYNWCDVISHPSEWCARCPNFDPFRSVARKRSTRMRKRRRRGGGGASVRRSVSNGRDGRRWPSFRTLSLQHDDSTAVASTLVVCRRADKKGNRRSRMTSFGNI